MDTLLFLLVDGVTNGAVPATLLGYDPTTVASTNSTVAAVASDTRGADGFTFDYLGNLWVTGGTTADPAVARYPASMFASDGTPTPDFTLDSATFSGIPGARVVTFDQQGNLLIIESDGEALLFQSAPEHFEPRFIRSFPIAFSALSRAPWPDATITLVSGFSASICASVAKPSLVPSASGGKPRSSVTTAGS